LLCFIDLFSLPRLPVWSCPRWNEGEERREYSELGLSCKLVAERLCVCLCVCACVVCACVRVRM